MRNVTRGLESRTKILDVMEKGKTSVQDISQKAGISQNRVAYHLKLFSKQRVVSMTKTGRIRKWTLTKYGQEKLF